MYPCKKARITQLLLCPEIISICSGITWLAWLEHQNLNSQQERRGEREGRSRRL